MVAGLWAKWLILGDHGWTIPSFASATPYTSKQAGQAFSLVMCSSPQEDQFQGQLPVQTSVIEIRKWIFSISRMQQLPDLTKPIDTKHSKKHKTKKIESRVTIIL